MRDYISHSEITKIYSRVDTNGNPYTRIVTKHLEYNCKESFSTDRNGIYGKFTII